MLLQWHKQRFSSHDPVRSNPQWVTGVPRRRSPICSGLDASEISPSCRRYLFEQLCNINLTSEQQTFGRRTREFATVVELPVTEILETHDQISPSATDLVIKALPLRPAAPVLTSLYQWPTFEPMKYVVYNPSLLGVPLRKDLLHRAIVYEGDNTRQGTAMAKHRSEVHGSGRKLHQQKGTGRARVGDKKSPIRRGGGVGFPPRGASWLPNRRSFATDLPRKMYDLAFRTALSYRHAQGELFIVENRLTIPSSTGGRLLNDIFERLEWGRGNGGVMMVTAGQPERLFHHMATVPKHGVVKDMFDIDVKDLLEKGRVVIEKDALDTLLLAHVADLGLTEKIESIYERDKDSIVHSSEELAFAGRTFTLPKRKDVC